jgi:Fe-Mn family superoxide dismutase
MVLHELYFDCLGGKGGEPTGTLGEKIRDSFGSFDNWKKEFLGIARTARGWALLCLFDGKLRSYSVDYHDIGAVWGAKPILALDVWEHAFYLDYGPDKEKYLEAFFRNLDWKTVATKLG